MYTSSVPLMYQPCPIYIPPLSHLYSIYAEPPQGPLCPRHFVGLKMVGKHEKKYSFKKSVLPISNICGGWALKRSAPKCHAEALGHTNFFFLWEIIQELFFLSWVFHTLVTKKNNFFNGPGSLLAYFWANNCDF